MSEIFHIDIQKARGHKLPGFTVLYIIINYHLGLHFEFIYNRFIHIFGLQLSESLEMRLLTV